MKDSRTSLASAAGTAGEASPAVVGDARLLGLARLMTLAFQGVDLTPTARQLIARAASDAADADAVLDLSTILQLQGLRELGLATQAHALASQRLYELPARALAGIRVLALLLDGDLMTNTPVEFLVADSDVDLRLLYLDPSQPLPSTVPPHDVVFVAVSQSERARPVLDAIAVAARSWGTPVVNRPERVPETSRMRAFQVLAGAPGVFIPPTFRLSRDALTSACANERQLRSALAGASLPLIVRPVDSHAGHGLDRVESLAAIAAYVESADADTDEFFVSPFVDYRDDDGLFRKYRVVLIDGVAYPGHMGVSSEWMIHYLNAGMTESAAKRAEEERFMAGFRGDFGRRHGAAFNAIHDRFGLDYLVIDCAETSYGELLVFEVCTGAVIHSMDPTDLFPYKRPHMLAIFAAFRALLGKSLVVR